MIRKIQHHQKMYYKSYDIGFKSQIHQEKHLVTTWYFLFIQIYQFKELLTTNL
jgi:hypothetical protein